MVRNEHIRNNIQMGRFEGRVMGRVQESQDGLGMLKGERRVKSIGKRIPMLALPGKRER